MVPRKDLKPRKTSSTSSTVRSRLTFLCSFFGIGRTSLTRGFKRRVGVEGFERLFKELTKYLMKAGVAKGRWIVVDSSAVEGYLHNDPRRQLGLY